MLALSLIHIYPLARPERVANGIVQLFNSQIGFGLCVHTALVGAQNIREHLLIAVLIGADHFAQGNLSPRFFLRTNGHENFILNTARGVGAQRPVLAAVKRLYRFDEPNGSDGDQILHISAVNRILFTDVRNQAQIVLNQRVARVRIPCLHARDHSLFFFRAQLLGKRLPLRKTAQQRK